MRRKGQKGSKIRVNKRYLCTRRKRGNTRCRKLYSEEVTEEKGGDTGGKSSDGLSKPSLTVTQSVTV